MIEQNENKKELKTILRNSIWENPTLGLSYKFQNDNDLWVNDTAHFNYKIEIFENKLVLLLYPNGIDFNIELKYTDVLYLHNDNQNFELRLRNRL